MESTKVCTACKVDKPRSEYYSRGDGTERVQAKCKVCCAAAADYQREWRKKNPEKARNSELKKNHGITLENYEAVLAEQGNACAICRTPPGTVGTGSKSKGRLAVDHCHVSGVFRGLLCTNCNLGLGSFFENVTLLENAAAYLKSHREALQRIIERENSKKKHLEDIIAASLQELREMP